MNYLKITIGIFIALSVSRFVPHPPNFTSLIALGFYVPAIIGIRYIPAVFVSFALTDLFIGFHQTILFTWGSLIIIGVMSKYFNSSIKNRAYGVFLSTILFYLLTNLGVWVGGSYGYTLEGLLLCYYLGLPFFGYSLISTFLFSIIIEFINKFFHTNYSIRNNLL